MVSPYVPGDVMEYDNEVSVVHNPDVWVWYLNCRQITNQLMLQKLMCPMIFVVTLW